MESPSAGRRIVFLDYLRVAACFMVIFVHSIEPFYLDADGTYIASSGDALWVTLLDSAARCAVPLFVLTSSYLLFPVACGTERFFRRRFTKVVVPFLFWAILYAVVPMWGSGGEVDLGGNLRHLLLNFTDNAGHLWFVYMLLGVYIAMPIISPWAERVSKRGERIFLAAWAFTTLVPFLHRAALTIYGRAEIWGEAGWNEFGTLYYISGFIGYVVAGHYIRKYVDWSWRQPADVRRRVCPHSGHLLAVHPRRVSGRRQYRSGHRDGDQLALLFDRSGHDLHSGVPAVQEILARRMVLPRRQTHFGGKLRHISYAHIRSDGRIRHHIGLGHGYAVDDSNDCRRYIRRMCDSRTPAVVSAGQQIHIGMMIRFRTEIDIKPLPRRIGYRSSILSLGSCFAQSMSRRLERLKFDCCSSPTGILFNPASIASALDMLVSRHFIAADELQRSGDVWFSYDFHSSFSHVDRDIAAEGMRQAVERGADALQRCDWAIITLGTAWVYRLAGNGRIAANCHKRPASEFTREMLDVQAVADILDGMVEGALRGRNVILTVSPVRHIGDGLQQNFLSKATLRIAAQRCADTHQGVYYFPSFEILNDDLRDYRFYADDMVHPSSAAVEYIWDKFRQSAIDDEAQALMPRVEKIVTAAAHRPLVPHSAAYAVFCRRQIAAIETMPEVDLTEEKEYFSNMLQINS